MRLLFTVKTLNGRGGGAERVLASVVSGLALRGHDVTVATCDPVAKELFYSVDPAVHTVSLDVGNVTGRASVGDMAARIRALHRLLVRTSPDVAVGFMHSLYVPLGLAALGTGVPVVASEHIGPEYYRRHFVDSALMRLAPLTAERITVVSEQIRLAYDPWLRRKMTVAENPVDLHVGPPADVLAEGKRPKILLCVGRLEPQKDHKVLVAAFSRIAPALPDWNLRIVGDGSLRKELEAQVRELGLTDRVLFPGFTSDVDLEYRNAQLFALPSLFESFGLVSAEALLHQLPVVGFADCPGTNQLVRHGENGLLVSGRDRVGALADALKSLMSNPAERARLGSARNGWIVEKFELSAILDKWERLLREVGSHVRG